MSLSFNLERKPSARSIVILAAASIVISAIYIAFSAYTYRLGFPLDDAWIHQTYARNLALRGEFAFLPGKPSAGSTAPLWSALLAIGFLLQLSPHLWAYFLGALILFAFAVICESAALNLSDAYQPKLPWVGLFFAIEWHLVWAAMSGMETLLHALGAALVLILLMMQSKRFGVIGALIGLAVWVRPDGLTLIAPALVALWLGGESFRVKFLQSLSLALGFGIFFVPYLLFNLLISGSPMPNTFYAKQAEYAALLQVPLIARVGSLGIQPLIGAGLALVPGAVIWIVQSLRRKNVGVLAASLWMIGYLILYAVQLPVSYQHGRYQMPMMPIYFLIGLLGALELRRSILKTAWQMFIAALSVAFIVVGSQAYAQDVAVIESEMVDTAQWVAQNLPADAIVAAHDIGALGYFGEHPLIDLAGLIDPAPIPFLRDEHLLANWIDRSRAEYLITFPGWYPALIQRADPIFATQAVFAPALGGENMTVYRWVR